MKKLIACTLALLFVFTFVAACGSSDTPAAPADPGTPADSGTSADTGTAGDSGAAAADDVVTFTFYNEDGTREQPWNTPIAELITQLTGVRLELSYPTGGLDVEIPLMTASGDYPDLIYGKGNGAALLIEARAAINLAPYFDNSKYLKDFYGELYSRLWYDGDPNTVYSVGAYAINTPVWNADPIGMVQLNVLKDAGYPTISTYYEAEELMKAYGDANNWTTADGNPMWILSLNNADNWRYIIDLGNPSGLMAGMVDHGEWAVNQDTLEASIKYLDPRTKEWFAWANKLWNEGLVDPDCFTQQHEDWEAKHANGQVLFTVSPRWMMDSPEQTARTMGNDGYNYARLPLTWDNSYPNIALYDNGWSGGWGVMITTACTDPQRAFDFLDWCGSEEGLVTRYWGVEGVHYDYVDGIRVLKPDVEFALNNDPDYGNSQGFDWAYPFPEIGDGWTDSTGSTYTRNTPQSIIDNYSPAAKEALAAYGAGLWADLFPPTSSFSLSKFGAAWQIDIPPDSEINDKMQWVQNTWLPQEMAKVVMASTDQFEAVWEASQQMLLDYGVLELNAEFTELVRAKAAAWGNY